MAIRAAKRGWPQLVRKSSPESQPGHVGSNRLQASGEPSGAQIVIGVDDRAQLVFARPVTAIGVGMKPLHQLLVARLDGPLVGAAFDAKRIERLAGRIADTGFSVGL